MYTYIYLLCDWCVHVFYFPFSLFFGLQCKWHIFHGFDITAIYVLILDQKRRNIIIHVNILQHNKYTRMLQQKNELLSKPKTLTKKICTHTHTCKRRMYAIMDVRRFIIFCLINMLIGADASGLLLPQR